MQIAESGGMAEAPGGLWHAPRSRELLRLERTSGTRSHEWSVAWLPSQATGTTDDQVVADLGGDHVPETRQDIELRLRHGLRMAPKKK